MDRRQCMPAAGTAACSAGSGAIMVVEVVNVTVSGGRRRSLVAVGGERPMARRHGLGLAATMAGGLTILLALAGVQTHALLTY